METAKIKLVTIVAAAELQERLEAELRKAGAKGFTAVHADGRGSHGAHRASFLDRGNVRLEVLSSAEVARKLLELVVSQFAQQEIVAFVQDVEAVPFDHF